MESRMLEAFGAFEKRNGMYLFDSGIEFFIVFTLPRGEIVLCED